MASSAGFVAVSGGLLLGGSTTFLLNLASGFRAHGEELRVLTLTDSNEHAADFAELGVEVAVIDHRRMIYEDRLREGYRQLARWQPRTVLACLSSESYEMLRLAPPGVQRLGVIQSHLDGPYALADRYAEWLDGMVGVATEIRTALEASPALAGRPAYAIPYGIHYGEPVARAPRSPGEPLRLIYVGRLIEEQKRMSRLVALAGEFRRRQLPVHFTLVGSGPQEAEVRRQLAGFEGVEIHSAVPNRRVAELLRQNHAFVLLSDYEGLPLALLEAMGAGLVPIASDLPTGINEAVPAGAGFRVPIGDIPAAVEAVKTLLEQPARWQAMSAAASAHAREHFSDRRMAGDYLALMRGWPNPAPAWPADVRIPTPLGLSPRTFNGPGRQLRRWLKKLLVSARGSSSRG